MEYADIPTSPTSLPQYGEKSSLSHDEDDSLLGMAENRRARRPKAKRSRFFTLDLRYCLSINLALTSFNLAILLGLAVLWKNGKLVQEPARISPTLSVLPPCMSRSLQLAVFISSMKTSGLANISPLISTCN